MKIFAIGASKNIAYFATLRLLQQGHHVVFLLRNPSVFDANADMKPFLDSASARRIKGDALNKDDLTNAWTQALSDGPVDVVLFTVGTQPAGFSLTKGFLQDPPNLCTLALLNTLATYPQASSFPQPRFVVVTVHGVTKSSHATLPLAMRPLWAMIKIPHADKLGMEKILGHSAGWTSSYDEPGLTPGVLPSKWEDRLPGKGWLKHVVIVRPALLTDGAEKTTYRVGEQLNGLYSVSRRDVAHFIAGDLLEDWAKYDGKAVSIGY